jgi:hypothetical protein
MVPDGRVVGYGLQREILRTYQPRRAILERTYHLPPLELA